MFRKIWMIGLFSIGGSVLAMNGINLITLKLPKSQNYYFMCPKNVCDAMPNEMSPVFNVKPRALYERWAKMIAKQPRVELVYIDDSKNLYEYVQRSKWLYFPDTIYIQFVPITETTSSFIIFSRSRYGYYDFGVNKKRIQKWVSEL